MTKTLDRFNVLDSWRGIAACLVALFHFETYSHFYDLPFLRNAYLFVDFFFVLSGFVIAANYEDRLLHGYSLRRFMILRLGRLYPLHLFMLLAFVAYELLPVLVPPLRDFISGTPFGDERHSIFAIVTNVLLVHSFGLHSDITWNGPSWSISTEVFAYLVFALIVAVAKTKRWVVMAGIIIAAPLIILKFSKAGMDTTYDFGFVRCLFGFCVGVVCFYIFRTHLSKHRKIPEKTPEKKSSRSALITGLEIMAVMLMVTFICIAGTGPLSVAAPFVFAPMVLIFSLERGFLSQCLSWRPLIFIGTLSYSIYMVHRFVQMVFFTNAGRLVEMTTGTPTTTILTYDGGLHRMLGTNPWQGDLLLIIMLAVVIGVSWSTYCFVEQPPRDWFRRLANR